MKWSVVLVLASCAFVNGFKEESNKVLIDLLIEKQLVVLKEVLKNKILTTITLGDYTLPGNKITARGVKMGDLSTLKVTDHSYMWTSPGNSIEAQVFVGLDNMTILVDSLTFNEKTFPASFTIGINSLGFNHKMVLQENKCQQTFSEIAFYNLDDVKIYTNNPSLNGQDISLFVKMEILPYANEMMQQKIFLDWINENFNVCY